MGELPDNVSLEGLHFHYQQGVEAFRAGKYPREFIERPDLALEVFEAHDWIQKYRQTFDGSKINMFAMADELGLEIEFVANKEDSPLGYVAKGGLLDVIHETPWGPLTSRNEYKVVLAHWLSSDEAKLTFGHEIGHYFLSKVMRFQHSGGVPHIENFCEIFGAELVMPLAELRNVQVVNERVIQELMARYDASLHTAIFQLVLAGKLPESITIKTNTGNVRNESLRFKDCEQTFCMKCELVGSAASECSPTLTQQDPVPCLDFSVFEREGLSFPVSCLNNKDKYY
jgi:hypothetical protein